MSDRTPLAPGQVRAIVYVAAGADEAAASITLEHDDDGLRVTVDPFDRRRPSTTHRLTWVAAGPTSRRFARWLAAAVLPPDAP